MIDEELKNSEIPLAVCYRPKKAGKKGFRTTHLPVFEPYQTKQYHDSVKVVRLVSKWLDWIRITETAAIGNRNDSDFKERSIRRPINRIVLIVEG